MSRVAAAPPVPPLAATCGRCPVGCAPARPPAARRVDRVSVRIWSRDSGPRRYDSVQRVWNTDGPLVVHVVQQEHALVQRREEAIGLARDRAVPAAAPSSPSSIARLVALGLQPAEEPRAGVRRAPCSRGRPGSASPARRRAPNARPCFSSVSSGALRRRVRDRREVAEDLVHVDDGAQARRCRSARRIHATIWLSSSDDEEHPLGVAEVGDREDRDARLAFRRVEQRRRIERLAFEPLLEARARRAGRSAASPARSAPWPGRTTRDRRRRLCGTAGVWTCWMSAARSRSLPVAPGRGRSSDRQQGVLAAARRRRRRRRATARSMAVLPAALRQRARRRRAPAPRGAANELRIDTGTPAGCPACRWRTSAALRSRAIRAPSCPHAGQPVAPALRLLRGEGVGRQPGAARLVLVDPRAEVLGGEVRERQQQVAEVALRVDGDDRDAVDGRFLDQRRGRARSCRCRSCRRRRRG